MRKLLGLVTVFTLFWPWPVESQQPTFLFVNHADPSCDGKSPCYSTIQAAVEVAQPGSVIRIQAGTYPEQISIEKNKFPNATEFDRIIVEADPALQPGQVILTGAPGLAMHGKMGDPDEAIKIYNDPRFDYYRDRRSSDFADGRQQRQSRNPHRTQSYFR